MSQTLFFIIFITSGIGLLPHQLALYSLLAWASMRMFGLSKLPIRKLIGKFPNWLQWKDAILKTLPALMGTAGLGMLFVILISFIFPKATLSHLEINYERLYVDALVAILFAPIIEEILFRGILVPQLAKKYGIPKAIIFSSLFFGICHSLDAPGDLLFGIIISINYIYTQSLWIPIFLHVLNNSIIFALILMEPRYQTPTLTALREEWSIALVLTVLGLPFIYTQLRSVGLLPFSRSKI